MQTSTMNCNRMPGHPQCVGQTSIHPSRQMRILNIRGWLASCLLRHCPANGGFSLRTRKTCKLAAAYWRKHYSNHHFSPEEGEDMFYTDILPKRHTPNRLSTHIGDAITCGRFSYDESFLSCPPCNPLGFHSAKAFRTLLNSGYITQ